MTSAAAAEPTVVLHGLQGVTPHGTPAFSNQNDETFTAEVSKSGHFATGFRWQCVEFARRWLWDAKGLILPSIPMAAHIFYLGYVHDPALNRDVPTKSTRNGTTEPPVADSLIIYAQDSENFVGHVGVIVEATETYIRVADQNRFFHHWEGKTYSKEFPVEKRADGTYWIIDAEARPLGWVTFPGYATLPPVPDPLAIPADMKGDVAVHLTHRPFPAHMTSPPEPKGRWTMLRLMGSGIRTFSPHPFAFFYLFVKLILRVLWNIGFKRLRFSSQFDEHNKEQKQQTSTPPPAADKKKDQ